MHTNQNIFTYTNINTNNMNVELYIKMICITLSAILVYLIYLSTCLTIVIQNGFVMYNEKLNHIKWLLQNENKNKNNKENKKRKKK